MKKNNIEELVDIYSTALGYYIEFNTGIVIHKKNASYIIYNKPLDDGETYQLITKKYTREKYPDETIYNLTEASIVDIIEEDNKPILKIVK